MFCANTSRALLNKKRVSGTYSTDYSDMPVILRSTCQLDRLKFKIHGIGKVSIWDTPHYKFLAGLDKENTYPCYIEKYYGSAEVQPSITRFRSLGAHLSECPERNILLTRSQFPFSNTLLVVDGTHRAAFAALKCKLYVDVALTQK